MEDFNQRKEKYLQELNSDIRIINLITNFYNNTQFLNIILMPQTEKELDFASKLYTFGSQIIDIFFGNYQTKYDFDVNESITIELHVKLIKAFMDSNIEIIKEVESYLDNLYNIKEQVKVIYDFLITYKSGYDSVIKLIAQKCGFDINNVEQKVQFSILLKKAQKIINKNRTPNISFSDINGENVDINNLINFFEEFNSLYAQGKTRSKSMI